MIEQSKKKNIIDVAVALLYTVSDYRMSLLQQHQLYKEIVHGNDIQYLKYRMFAVKILFNQ